METVTKLRPYMGTRPPTYPPTTHHHPPEVGHRTSFHVLEGLVQKHFLRFGGSFEQKNAWKTVKKSSPGPVSMRVTDV